jgi:Ser-tRNA(Ala) deacylase AlaX
MQKVFWDNPYQKQLRTKVVSVKGCEILLEKTIAYSFSGGQESDKAFIDDLEILSSRMEGNLIYYALPDNHQLSENQDVLITIDWDRRYRLMRLHFAAELILELVTRKFQLEKLGAHIAEEKARIDFKSDFNISTVFDELLTDYNEVIKGDRLIHTGFTDIETQRRFWKIDGFAQVPCGGTHVKSTNEVGFVTLKRARPGKSIERIEIRLVNA